MDPHLPFVHVLFFRLSKLISFEFIPVKSGPNDNQTLWLFTHKISLTSYRDAVILFFDHSSIYQTQYQMFRFLQNRYRIRNIFRAGDDPYNFQNRMNNRMFHHG